MTRVAILWHMHQPYYEDLVTREHILPWVRLHALKDYWGMVAMLDEFPDVRVTFNLVPSLLVQLEAFAADRVHDRYLELGLKPAHALMPEDVRFILRNFFHAQRQRMIDVFPRYAELLSLRGWGTGDVEIEAAARRFGIDDLRDLQVWQKLAWIDPAYHERDPRVQALVRKGRLFTEDDKQALRAVELEILNAVIPAYRRGVESGHIEVSTSPFYHPILPLLCDTDIYKRTHPMARSPRQRFTRPDDALAQLEQAADYHERLFGKRPAGVWPSEGSVSDAMVPLVAQAGFRWMATDEMILANSLGTTFGRDGRGLVEQAERLYQPYAVVAGGSSVSCGFRDHALSDLIGFVYAGWSADSAAEDFVARLVDAGRQAVRRGAPHEPTIFVILDGENAWEHFEGGGRPFLRALYQRLASHSELRTVTMADACANPGERLHGIFPGSWIDANFYIWIGHADDQRAWSQVAEARCALDEAAGSGVDAETLARARQEMFIAEGSDWCWWYGDDHSSEHDAEFDELFRRHLRNIYRLLQRPIPDELFITNISTGGALVQVGAPTAHIEPVLDGEDSSYFEWLCAGLLDIRPSGGAMHQVDHQAIITQVRFGFSRDSLFLRIDPSRDAGELFEDGWSVVINFLRPSGIRVWCAREGTAVVAGVAVRAGSSWVKSPAVAHVAVGSIIELQIPLVSLGGDECTDVSFFVAAHDANQNEAERHPAGRPIELTIPDERFDARNWTA
ncbi:MAG TPA: glycoside hydrolase family 57 protein [Vicinamibacterales bacterium]|nr:glycoside hydrolase family 57 protein [Vicinamibacterales bacterium]